MIPNQDKQSCDQQVEDVAALSDPGNDDRVDYVQQLTADGHSAIAVFKIVGLKAIEVAQQYLQLRGTKRLLQRTQNHIHFGHWHHHVTQLIEQAQASEANSDGGLPRSMEDVVVCRTGEASLELHTHGSVAVAKSIQTTFARHQIPFLNTHSEADSGLDSSDDSRFGSASEVGFAGVAPESLLNAGAFVDLLPNDRDSGDWDSGDWVPLRDVIAERLVPLCQLIESIPSTESQTEVSEREGAWLLCGFAHPNHFIRWVQSLAVSSLFQTTAPATGQWMMRQATGDFLAVMVQVSDHCHARPQVAVEMIDTLLGTWKYGQHFRRPLTVLLTGKPNVGKSSLINAMVGYNRAIVSATPGTTRDLVAQETVIAGWPFRLIDSAGIRGTEDLLERQGVDLATSAAKFADLVVHISTAIEISAEIESEDHLPQQPSTIDSGTSKRPEIWVVNKVDLLDDTQKQNLERNLDQSDNVSLATSTYEGSGIPQLLQAIADQLVPRDLQLIDNDTNDQVPSVRSKGIVFCSPLVECLQAIKARLESTING